MPCTMNPPVTASSEPSFATPIEALLDALPGMGSANAERLCADGIETGIETWPKTPPARPLRRSTLPRHRWLSRARSKGSSSRGHDNDIESPVLSTRLFDKADKALRLALEAPAIRLSLRSMNASTCRAP